MTKQMTRQNLKDYLLIHGAFSDDFKHSGRYLGDHLLGTYDLLKEHGCKENVCLAGGLHSIYGTNAYQKSVINNRDFIKNVFGEDVEYLVWLFHTLKRPSTLETSKVDAAMNGWIAETNNKNTYWLSHKELIELRLIEYANLFEQGSDVNRFPNIVREWEKNGNN